MWDINLHIAAWEKAAREHREKGEIELAEFAEGRAAQFKCARVPRHLG
jgi:hypothetical protein